MCELRQWKQKGTDDENTQTLKLVNRLFLSSDKRFVAELPEGDLREVDGIGVHSPGMYLSDCGRKKKDNGEDSTNYSTFHERQQRRYL